MTEPAGRSRRGTSPGEWVAAAALLLALPAIALGIYLAGRGGALPPPEGDDPGGLNLVSSLPLPAAGSQFKITTAPQEWPAERMYEKIDGEDAVYLRHGCVGLAAATLTAPDTDETIDMYLYRMATPAAAEKIFTEQAPREDAPDAADRPEYVKIGDRAYTSYGCCYVRSGPFYLKLIAGADTPATAGQVLDLARRFVKGLGAAGDL